MKNYSKTIRDYLNTNQELDYAVFAFWNHWGGEKTDINSARRGFLDATAISPNIGRVDHYVPHCLQVSRRCENSGRLIAENYPYFSDELNPNKLAFMGLVKDSMYLIGGNGKNNKNRLDSNPVHEILTFIQMKQMGLEELANGMAMHGIASEMLKGEQEKGRFKGVVAPKQNITLDLLTGIDFLCDRDYLPDKHGSYENCLKFRIYGKGGIKERRDANHPLVIGLDNGGESKLSVILDRIGRMESGKMSEKEIMGHYGS